MSKYGWIRDLPDHRDHRYEVAQPIALPSSADLRPLCPPVYDQGDLGSCTAQAIAAAIEVDRRKQSLDLWTPSRLFIYFNERAMEGTIHSDAGAQIRDGIKSVNRQGAPHEARWPYEIPKFDQQPPRSAYNDAKHHRSLAYARVPQNLVGLRHCLALQGPVVIGISVYQSFEEAASGEIPLPGLNEPLLGGHAILIVGYDDQAQRFRFRNSWSSAWGDQGYGTLPYTYLTDTDLAADAWTILTMQ